MDNENQRTVRERGQAMIMFAVLAPLLMLVVGLAVEGSRMFVEYRQLQSAADMAALVGAQKLPCNLGDTGCIQVAENQACQYALANGFTSCSPGSSSNPSANVPPVSCSPYDFMDYGNGATNASCKSALSPPFYDYIEVRLKADLGRVPIFNQTVSLGAHAIAKSGVGVPGDFAVIQLDPASSFDLSGSNATYIVGSVFGNGGISGNGVTLNIACQGGWFGGGAVTGVGSNTTGTPSFSPAGCSGGSLDAVPDIGGNLPKIADPYSGSVPPPTKTGNGNAGSPTFTGCPECSQAGWWYDLKNKKWSQGGSPSGYVELFPGVYDKMPQGGGPTQKAFFNPGVYTFTGGIDDTGGGSCVYGAPACDDTTEHCGTDQFATGTTTGDTWFYQCSPYGFWDSSSFSGTRPASLPTAPPYFWDESTGSYSTVPLNGVVFYLPSNSGGYQPRGNSGNQSKSAPNIVAAPNPCPGTGTRYTSQFSVEFPAGNANGFYTYPSTSLAYQHGTSVSPSVTNGASTWSTAYPSADLGLIGECGTTLDAWDGEMPNPQHLQMLFYVQGPGSDTKLRGTADQNYWGIFYAPSSDITFLGNSQTANASAPWMTGQVVMNTGTWGGNSTVSVYYRPCGPGSTACGSGFGTQLVQ
jgi:hypothetical protein